MSELAKPIEEALKRLLSNRKSVSEKSIQTEIVGLLRILDSEKFDTIEEETSISGKRMDIYLPRLRTIIETKKVGKAKPEVIKQLEPYIHNKILEEQNYLPFINEADQNRIWIRSHYRWKDLENL